MTIVITSTDRTIKLTIYKTLVAVLNVDDQKREQQLLGDEVPKGANWQTTVRKRMDNWETTKEGRWDMTPRSLLNRIK